MENKKEKLQLELEKYQKKLEELTKSWAETKGGSRYGDEYGMIQIKVYQEMIDSIKKELQRKA